jgi:8-oxo-dGTP diphosphatase
MAKFIDKLAWIHVVDGRILSTRTRGKDTYYIPGGKREEGENDWEALRREISEELSVDLIESTLEPAGVYEAQAHGHPDGLIVRMTCYRAEYIGELAPASEIEEVIWFDYSGRSLSSAVDQVIFDALLKEGVLTHPDADVAES